MGLLHRAILRRWRCSFHWVEFLREMLNTSARGLVSFRHLVLLEKDGGPEDRSHAVWLQTNFFVGSGDNKGSSFINVALGEWDPQTGITGFRRGGSIVLGPNESSTQQTYSFSGDVASLAGPNGSHFLGSQNPNIVIGADSTGNGHNIFRDTPLNPISGDNGNSRPEQQSGRDLPRRHRPGASTAGRHANFGGH